MSAAAAAAASEVHELSQRSASPKKVTAQRSDQLSVIKSTQIRVVTPFIPRSDLSIVLI